MKVPGHLRVGACSHPGHVRTANEDDYLLGALPGGPFFAAVADGMGGLAGGAEASRTALRAAAATVLDGQGDQQLDERVQRGFAAAATRVHEASQAFPALREMGTTLTVLCLTDDAVVVGHVGDTRLYRVRGGRCETLTEDHAVREPDNLLTRCIGAGADHVVADRARHAVQVGDRFVLVSDGVWSVLPEATFARLAARGPASTAAEALVAEALAGGGPDNATAVVVDVVAPAAAGLVDVTLPRHERPDERAEWPKPRSLRRPLWPWLAWFAGALLLAHAVLRRCGWPNGLLTPFQG